MKRLLLLSLLVQFSGIFSTLLGQCICTNCPQEMPDNFTGDFLINVSGAVNNDLGSPSQGVCGVYITFDHEYVGDLEITLTSPSGQSVTLLGPIGLFGETDGSLWNVLFVPCASPAAPDPNQSAIWSNDGFTSNENYVGSYYPNMGCLEDFNAGPVDGTWTLTVTDEQALDMGNFLNYNIVFCDDSGIECISCDPGGGTLPDPGFAGACEGSPELNLTIPPVHSFNEDPDPNEYDYLYVISQNDVIQEYVVTPDLSGYPVGVYEVCGLSYYIPDEPDIPAADGSLTVSVLQAQLESTTPPICGELSSNCLTIEIYAIPDPVNVEAVVCPNETYSIGNESFSASGIYTVNLLSVNGCDSMVILDLTVLEPAVNDVEATICDGDFFEIGNADFSQEGIFQITLSGQAAYGCDSTINLFLTVLNPAVFIEDPDSLNCENASVVLDASSSSFGLNASFLWSHAGGSGISGPDDEPLVEVTEPGIYTLTITETGPGGFPLCTASGTVEVVADVHLPTADAGPDLIFDCLTDSLALDGTGSSDSTGSPLAYSWTGPNGFTSDEIAPVVSDSGQYILFVENLDNGCVETDTAWLILDNIIEAYTPSAGIIGCLDASAALSVSSDPADSLVFSWTGPQGFQANGPDTLTEVPGDYTLYVTATNGCRDTVTVSVIENFDIPDISGSADTITCSTPVVQIQTESSFSQLAYQWSGPQNFASALPEPAVAEPGLYELTVTALNGCSNTLSVVVVSDTLHPVVVASSETLTCTDTSAAVSAVSTLPGVTFSWLVDSTVLTGPLINLAEPDTILLTATAQNGCSTAVDVVVEANQTPPVIDVPEPDTLTCNQETVLLDASGTLPSSNLVFLWADAIGDVLGTAGQLTVDAPGLLTLTVTDSLTGCVSVDTFTVARDTARPDAQAALSGSLTCSEDSIDLDGSQSTGNSELSWTWFNPAGGVLSNQSNAQTTVPGLHLLVVSQENGCSDTASLTVMIDTLAPVAVAATQDTLTCTHPEGLLSSAGSDAGSGYSGFWTNPAGLPAGTASEIMVESPGVYTWTVVNSQNGCVASDSATLYASEVPPSAVIAAPDTLNCSMINVLLDGSASTGQGNLIWAWNSAQGGSLGSASTLSVSQAGVYAMEVLDPENGCRDTALVTVFSDTIAPAANAGPDDTLTCIQPEILVGNISGGQVPSLQYVWSDGAGQQFATTDTLTVSTPGLFVLQVTNPINGCTAEDTVQIAQNVLIPEADAGQDAVLDCTADSLVLSGQSTTSGPLAFQWVDDDGIQVADAAEAVITAPGTYTFVVTLLNNGCEATDQVIISPDSQSPVVDITLPDTLTCSQTSVLLDGSTSSSGPQIDYRWYQAGQEVGQQSTLQVNEPGVYVLNVLNTQNACASEDQVVVAIDTTSPQISAGPDTLLNCLHPEVIITAIYPDPAYLLSWTYNGNIAIGPGIEQLITIPGLYTLTVTNPANGCTSVDQAVVTIDTAAPVIDVQAPSLLTCAATSVVLDGSGSESGPDFLYTWSNAQGQSLGTDDQLTVELPGSYTLDIVNQTNGCASTQTVTVDQDTAAPILPILSNQVLTCEMPTVVFDASSAPLSGIMEFSWFSGGQLVGNDALLQVTQPAQYTLTLTSIINQCETSVTVEVGQDTASPVVSIGPDGLLTCLQTDWQLMGSATGANQAFQYSWLNAAGTVLTTTSQFTTTEPGVFTFLVTDTLNGCTTTEELEVEENTDTPVAVPSVSGQLTCDVPSVTLSGAGSVATASAQYLWIDFQGGLVSSLQETGIDVPGTYQLVVAHPDNGCADTAVIEVLQDTAHPILVLSTPQPYILTCSEPELTMDASASLPVGQLAFSWTDGTGTLLSQLPTFNVTEEGAYTLQLINTVNGCETTESIVVSADLEVPFVVIAPPDTITCLQDTVVLSATGSSAGADYVYAWDGPGWVAGQNAQNIGVFVPGMYSLLVTDTENGCTSTAVVTVEERKELPTAVAAVSGELDCITPLVNLTGAGSSQGTEFTALWQTQTGGLTGNPQTLEVGATEPGLYTLLISNLQNGCTATAVVVVEEIEDRPEGALISIDQPSCFGERDGRIRIESVIGGTAPMLFFFKGQGPYDKTVFQNLSAGNYDLVIEDSRGCTWDTVLLVPTPPLLTVDLGDDQLIDLGADVFIVAQPNAQVDSALWLLPEDFSCPGILSCSDTPLVTTLYRIRVVDEYGCVAEDEMRVRVRKPRQVLIPNVFSPNDDGFNDYLFISVGNDVARVRTFGIYSRWGEQVFEKSDFLPSGDPKSDGWDGRFRGRQLDPDVFVGVAEIEFKDGTVEVFEGSVTLIR